MLEKEFDKFLDDHPELEHTLDDTSEHIMFRDSTILWYQTEGHFTKIAKSKFIAMTPKELDSAIYDSLRLEQITRITGYFTKVSGWNKGKMAELRDRKRCDDNFKTREGNKGTS